MRTSWETFSGLPIVLDSLCEVFRCSVITDLISAMFSFLKVLVAE